MKKQPKNRADVKKRKPISKKKVDDILEEELADDTMYGETIPSLMGWESFEEQRKRSDHIIEVSDELTDLKKSKEDKK